MKTYFKFNLQSFLKLLFLFNLLTIYSCKDDSIKDFDENKNCNEIKWSYKGDIGPTYWASLCENFSECNGDKQTPIDINTTESNIDVSLSKIAINYNDTKTHILNNGHTIEFEYDKGSSITVNKTTYDLLQFHFHTGSEHLIDGKQFDAELHLVHKDSTDKLAVIGVFFEIGNSNTLLEKYMKNFPESKSQPDYKSDKVFNIKSILPANLQYYSYQGSLTTPPCSEIVSWHVLSNRITASAVQINRLKEIMGDNFRPVHPINDRKIKLSN
ncbi:carbonic anhydrase family protein [Tenacibaculum pacificus]|uniref:carbonic anhydrase n=1 Tax=Tenacibaculum pacificus TaxID=3018314 RepID=UPI0022F3E30A|nr:carbonic anhydrase family protein [Tenacibaculum pacificus]WBX73736.1 carbonic anhydrase family protein [Tenacibaculum pacificus]